MTQAELEAVYKANIDKSFATALAAVYTQGWCAGAGSSIPASGVVVDRAASASKPTTIVKLSHK